MDCLKQNTTYTDFYKNYTILFEPYDFELEIILKGFLYNTLLLI